MDVLVLTSLYPPHSYGGYETSCRDVVERWRSRGHRVTVLTTATRAPGVADDPAERGVRRELSFYWDDHAIPRRTWRERLAIERQNATALARSLEDVRPDVVSAWAMGALSLGLLTTVVDRGFPLVLVVGDDWLSYGQRTDRWRAPFVGRPRLARAATRLTGLPTRFPPSECVTAAYVSDFVAGEAQWASWRPATSCVVSPGVDHEDFPVAGEAPDRLWRWRLLYVGRLDPRKGLDVAVDALARLPEARLDVVGSGDGAYAARLWQRAAARQAADRLTMHGGRPRRELARVYDDADVALFPVVWDEPFGIVPLEAMARGTPVVATGTGGSASYLCDGENCLLVPPGDDVALADAVQRLASDVGLRRRIVTGGLSTARARGADAYADRLEELHARSARR